MTLEILNLMTIPALGALGLWLEGLGGNHGFADRFFMPIPLASIGCIFVILGSSAPWKLSTRTADFLGTPI
jgi:hypothetical protein